MKIDFVSEDDAAALLEIYKPYVEKTAITFEYEVPSLKEFKERIKNISGKFPYLKAVDESGKIFGYVYAGTFKDRAAYNWSVETTVYVREDSKRKGIGKLLYAALEEKLSKMGILNMNACIALPRTEDEYLTKDSVFFHEKLGFKPVGIFHDSGAKFGRWYDMIWMEKMLGEHKSEPESVKFGKYRE